MDKRAALTDALADVMRYARALTRNADTAEDLLHDCVARALGRLDQFEAGTNMRAHSTRLFSKHQLYQRFPRIVWFE